MHTVPAQLNVSAPSEALASGRKLTDRLDTDRQEEDRIKHAMPIRSARGTENNGASLASPRRALFLAPSPRRQGVGGAPPTPMPQTPISPSKTEMGC